jgi:hypothetical protein
VHPSDEKPYAVYTDASKLGISSILTQKSDSGEVLIVSTASRVLTEVEKRYSTCEQELLAVVYEVDGRASGKELLRNPAYCCR